MPLTPCKEFLDDAWSDKDQRTDRYVWSREANSRLQAIFRSQSEAIDYDLVVTLPLNKNLPWYAAHSAIATGPLVGAGVSRSTSVQGSNR